MKKLCGISTKGGPSARGLTGALVPLFIVAIGFSFWTAAAALADDKSSSDKNESSSNIQRDKTKGSGEGRDKCIVCHNPHNFHEISIPCDQVDKFLQHHPGDFRGHCNVTPHTSK